jgi:hypothetical protein
MVALTWKRVALALGAGLVVARVILPPAELAWLPAPAVCAALGGAGLLLAWRRRGEPADVGWLRDPGLGVLVAALALLLATLASHNFRLTSDGVDHFVYLRSLWVDHDLDLANDYARVSPRGGSVDPPTPLGRTGNLHPVGPALLWSPLYAVADVLARLTGRPPDGDNALYRNAAALAGLLAGWLGLALVYRAALRLSGRGPALLAALGLGFGTFLYWYLAWAPTMAHGPAFAAAALVVALLLAPLPAERRGRLRRAAALGAACGLAALLRWADALVVVLPLVDALPRLRRRAEWRGLAAEAAVFALAAAVVFTPQLIVWKRLYGAFVTVPQGTAFLAGAPAVSGVLFSPRHGLFSWSPLLYAAVAGLILGWRRAPRLALGGLLLLALLTRVNAGTADWWGGAAFGGRRFDAALAPLGIGLALGCAALARGLARRPLAGASALVAVFVGWNLLLAAQYRSGAWDYSEPVAFEQMGHAAVSRIDRALGSPFSLPGALWERVTTGRALADYESLFSERPYSRWSIRMGLDDRLFLEDGWSQPRRRDGIDYRALVGASAGLVVALHRPADYRFTLRAAVVPLDDDGRGETAPAARVRVIANRRALDTLDVGSAWSDLELTLPREGLRAGRNLLRLRVVALSGAAELAVAGAALEPASAR